MDPTTTNTPLQVTIYPVGATPATSKAATASTSSSDGQFWSSEGPTFKDILDTINPLQHIPIISTIYQSLTGDVQSTGAKFAGAALFGGVAGFAASVFDTIIKQTSGSDIATNLMDAVEGKPIPALHNNVPTTLADGSPSFLSPNQRASYNAYVRTNALIS